MKRYLLPLALILGQLIACSRQAAQPLATDIKTESGQQVTKFNPNHEKSESYMVRAATGAKTASGVRGIYDASQYYGTDAKFTEIANYLFPRYPQLLSSMYSLTLQLNSYINFWQKQNCGTYTACPTYFPPATSSGGVRATLAINSSVLQYRIYADQPEQPNYYGYGYGGYGYVAPVSHIESWNRVGNVINAVIVLYAGSTVSLYTALAMPASPTLSVTASVASLVTGGSTTLVAPAPQTQDLSSLVKAQDSNYYYGGYIGQVNVSTLQVGDVAMTFRGESNDQQGLQYQPVCWYCN